MRVLITGITGFAGSHLAEGLLSQPDVELFGAAHGPLENIAHLQERVTLDNGDLTDSGFVNLLWEKSRPERVYHLAGQSFPPASRQDPWATFETNVRAAVNILERTRAPGADFARILIVGSMEEYGHVDARNLPVTEDAPFCPNSPYGVSKVAQDLLALQYFLSRQLHVIRVRPTNHIGPRQNEQFVTANFAKQIAEIEAGRRAPVLRVGNLAAERDFVDVRDMAQAYVLALERGVPGEAYNIGAGKACSIQKILDLLLKQSTAKIRVEQDPARLRPSDTPVLYCSAEKFQAQTGWRPTIPLETSLRDILNYWREMIKRHP